MTVPSASSSKTPTVFAGFPLPWVVISNKPAFRKALDHAGPQSFTAVSPLYAGCAFGLPWWEAVLADAPPQVAAILDCGESAALAVLALSNDNDKGRDNDRNGPISKREPSEGVFKNVFIRGAICRNFPPPQASSRLERLFTAYPEAPPPLSLEQFLRLPFPTTHSPECRSDAS